MTTSQFNRILCVVAGHSYSLYAVSSTRIECNTRARITNFKMITSVLMYAFLIASTRKLYSLYENVVHNTILGEIKEELSKFLFFADFSPVNSQSQGS